MIKILTTNLDTITLHPSSEMFEPSSEIYVLMKKLILESLHEDDSSDFLEDESKLMKIAIQSFVEEMKRSGKVWIKEDMIIDLDLRIFEVC
jgi:hypothetical protein